MSNRIENNEGSDFTYSSHLGTQGELQIYDEYDSEEYEHFVFLVDSIHEYFDNGDSQFDFGFQEHVDMHFHSEKDEDSNSSFYMNYENDFVSPNLLMRNSNVFGEIDGSNTYRLPQED